MEAKHTPGPWSSYNLEVRSGPNPDCQKWPTGRLIADCYHTPPAGHFDGGENAANAQLIAAAPDLLEALSTSLTAMRKLVSTDQEWLVAEEIEKAEKAIARATNGGD
jgi:hypothetical protein